MDIQILDKTFVPYISAEEIQLRLKELALQMTEDFKDEECVFVGVLNGSFMFLSDLIKYYQRPCEISFVKMASYQGLQTTNEVRQLLGLDVDVTGKTVVIVEDIVDTGNTIEVLCELFNRYKIKDLKIITLFHKPEAYTKTITLDYIGFNIPDKFIVGYGLDYNKQGRNIPEVYQIK